MDILIYIHIQRRRERREERGNVLLRSNEIAAESDFEKKARERREGGLGTTAACRRETKTQRARWVCARKKAKWTTGMVWRGHYRLRILVFPKEWTRHRRRRRVLVEINIRWWPRRPCGVTPIYPIRARTNTHTHTHTIHTHTYTRWCSTIQINLPKRNVFIYVLIHATREKFSNISRGNTYGTM